MTVALVGDGPAADAVRVTLTDADAALTTTDPAGIGEATLAVVVAGVGEGVHETANEVALDAGVPWLAVELGGVGATAVSGVEAAVSGFGPDTACYDCLGGRVAANRDGNDGGDATPPDAATARLAGALAGREAVRLLDGASDVIGSVTEVPHARRDLLPLPRCTCGSGVDRTLRQEYAPQDLDGALDRAERAVDDRVGIVRQVGEVASFPVPYYLAQVGETTGFSDVQASQQAAGVALDWDAAYMKAIGEALERYSAGVFSTADFGTARAGDVPNTVGLDEFVLPDDVETGGQRRWVTGEHLHDGESVFLPAERVQFPLSGAGPTITTGLGLGNSGAEALVAGLTEVVERDAAMLSWYSTYDPLGLAVDDEGYDTLVRRARSEDLSVTATLLTQDVDVPVVSVAVHREGEWPRFALGTDADLDVANAARAACCEALQNWTELSRMGKADARNAGGRIGHFASLPDSARAFTDPETTIPADSVGDDVAGEDELDELLGRVGDAGLDAYAARLTPRDVERLGFEAVRVLVPEAQPLFMGEAYFGERAETVPGDLGFEARLGREHHPFP
ncbi:YcaO-like family protein [Halomarina litorea]|uniref:YcaO-like family protein n=1 Tax=Halomarina litorea TaxID=2961595 RepID=UPI0020C49477|nr:YcaO-like family protein [Halomarina sp. BCD28]